VVIRRQLKRRTVLGAVHTWHKADVARTCHHVRT
jgi:hypothetical protein